MAACRVAGLHEYCFSQRENGLLTLFFIYIIQVVYLRLSTLTLLTVNSSTVARVMDYMRRIFAQ
ncbi:Uncharacterized protein APZ42_028479 [Daphnia magna]|uniref:Uncharacterized protein n=1 Tax=Daphnia magna TaxID=35525 RepID=A0A164QGW7_9CRUS|nr:Uncharacterized protein APZ42_028479 [Daphnia magna]